MELKIEYVNKEELKPYANNAKIHTPEQIEQIERSIREFGFNDPIAVWKNNEVIEGHGRLLAAMRMDDIKTVPVIRLDDLSDEERRAYTLVHNKLTIDTGFDYDILNIELDNILDIDMDDFGLEKFPEVDWNDVPDLNQSSYEEPQHEMLECPKCHHVDRTIHFKKVKGGAEN